jgi:hypothetical protein
VLTLLPADLPDAQERHALFLQALRQLGWTEGACASRFTGVLAIPTDFRKYAVELNALALPGQIRGLHYWDPKWIFSGAALIVPGLLVYRGGLSPFCIMARSSYKFDFGGKATVVAEY